MALTNSIIGSEDSEGVFGKRSRKNLKRLPSSVYWQGLGRWGIRLFPGSQSRYHHSLDSFYGANAHTGRTDDGEPLDDVTPPNWHEGLPPESPGFLKRSSFMLSKVEAEYLRERILSNVPGTLLTFLVDRGERTEAVDFPWEHPQLGEFPSKVREQLHHARNFSEAIHGAPLLYNLMLAEAKRDEGLAENYGARLSGWAALLERRHSELGDWNRDEFWRMASSEGYRMPPAARAFVDRWLDMAMHSKTAAGMAVNEEARRMISDRELALKGGLARLHNQSALELWNEAAGIYQIDYRWWGAQRIVSDILRGLAEGEDA